MEHEKVRSVIENYEIDISMLTRVLIFKKLWKIQSLTLITLFIHRFSKYYE